ncbi:hypothetical protein A2U01_0023262 [Trifolium medium]|uniref:Uncharacterized protein n=1 Tax=Trifolium medium TaxID=97028 RepID=A0A392NSM7_9FABA|nr:hypothetical protein [Trifolium medium]
MLSNDVSVPLISLDPSLSDVASSSSVSSSVSTNSGISLIGCLWKHAKSASEENVHMVTPYWEFFDFNPLERGPTHVAISHK